MPENDRFYQGNVSRTENVLNFYAYYHSATQRNTKRPHSTSGGKNSFKNKLTISILEYIYKEWWSATGLHLEYLLY